MLRFWLCAACASLQPERVRVLNNGVWGDSQPRHCEFCKDNTMCAEFELHPSIEAIAAATKW